MFFALCEKDGPRIEIKMFIMIWVKIVLISLLLEENDKRIEKKYCVLNFTTAGGTISGRVFSFLKLFLHCSENII